MTVIYAVERVYALVKPLIEGSFSTSVTVDDVTTVTKHVPVEWGRTRPPVNVNGGSIGRVVFVPGDVNGDLGPLEAAKQWPQPARPLLTLPYKFGVYVYGRNPAAHKADDPSHDHAAFRVLHEVIRRLRAVTWNPGIATSPVTIGSPKILKPLAQHVLGTEYLVPCSVEQPILDMFDDDPAFLNVAPAGSDITETLGNYTATAKTAATEDP
jgi:hypothetical protein